MYTIQAQKRSVFGKKLKQARKEGRLPAVFYGRKEKATPIFVSYPDFLKTWKEAGESSVITLAYPDKNFNVLIHEVSFDPVRGKPVHADFYVVESDREVEVEVPLVFEGIAPAVKEGGGTLIKVLHSILVSGIPAELPHEIVVDLSVLKEINDRITIEKLKVPPGITFSADKNEVVALVSASEEELETEAAPEFNAAAIEVEKKGKQEEGSEDKQE